MKIRPTRTWLNTEMHSFLKMQSIKKKKPLQDLMPEDFGIKQETKKETRFRFRL